MKRVCFCSLLLVTALASESWAQAGAPGRTIRARDGDTVLLPGDATITLVRTVEGRIKLASHGDGKLLILLIDEGLTADGRVDVYHRFELREPFAAQYLWDGPGSVEEHEGFGAQRGRQATVVVIPAGRILLLPGHGWKEAPVGDTLATFHYTGSGSQRVSASFAEAEQAAITGHDRRGFRTSVQLTVLPAARGGVVVEPNPSGPEALLRVGGAIRAPQTIKEVPAVLPEVARHAGVRGTVILEITVDSAGRVRDAKVLRSIPLLDEAALTAVRQWEFTPTLLNGVPREIVMTVAVPFE
jgi:TonB family protein